MDDDGERLEFDLNLSLKYYLDDPLSVPCSNADPELLEHEGDINAVSNDEINRILDPIIDQLAVDPAAIAKESVLDTLQCLLKHLPNLPVQSVGKVLDILVSGLSAETDVVSQDIETEAADIIQEHRGLLEIYCFLLQWGVMALELKAAANDKPAAAAAPARKKAQPKSAWNSEVQLQHALEAMCKVLKLKLLRLFVTTSERDTFVSLFTRPVYLVLENEQRVKTVSIRMHVFKVLCMAVKHHGHGFGAQTSIVQNLTYFEHLSEPMAEFLQILAEQYDYPQLVDEILKDLSNKQFNSNDTKGPKSVSGFIIRLSELAPRLMIKQMTLVVKFLDSESYALRCAVIEVCGNLIVELTKENDERSENYKAQMNVFFGLLEERFLDINPYCRCKVIQVYTGKLLDLDVKFPKRRQKAADLACRSLEDKSSNVRRNAIKLLIKLIATHPFSALHGGTLKLTEWQQRLDAIDAELSSFEAPIQKLAENNPAEQTVDQALLDDATMIDGCDEEAANEAGEEESRERPVPVITEDHSEQISRLQLTRRYYAEALRFIDTIHDASETVCQLLGAKNKSEVIEAMEFFRSLDAHQVETAKVGIRRMLRLIWTKGNSDEGKGIQAHLIEVYKDLFFDAPDNFSENESANFIARNMISLTFDTTSAELTSLEQLLCKMMAEGHVSDLVVRKLWQIYGYQGREISRTQRRGAIIVLGMLALAEPDIVIKELELVLKIGLGPLGKADLGLAKWTCVALRYISTVGKKLKEGQTPMSKLPNDHAILLRLASLVELRSNSNEWFGLAEQALGAIYALSKHPDNLCSEIIRRKTKSVFEGVQEPENAETNAHADEDHPMEDAEVNDEELPDAPPAVDNQRKPDAEKDASYFPLSQLLFVIGHVAVKQIVHLEIVEMDFKRRKNEMEKAKEASASKKDSDEERDELDLIGGTTEDDFTEAMSNIREHELLFAENAILSNFGPMVRDICANNDVYRDRTLQAQATLCMAKLMCVSAEYCQENLPLLITIMERSTDPITRSNAVIALGDMAVCFNHLIDENTDFLYRRLNDTDPSVKRTCLMTLTFLILAGQVKVKGQLGEMAKCLEDSDRRIADLSKMFFTELATKDNAVYNHFVDMFSLLSAEEELSEDALKRILKFLVSFIEKDRHAKQLAEKLAARLPRCETEKQWNEVAYALTLLQHKSEEIQKTVAAGFRVVQANA